MQHKSPVTVWFRPTLWVGSAIGALVASLSIALVARPVAQAPPQEQRPPVFRAGTTFVSVDVYPRRGGSIVQGLRAEDFQVFEDGKLQPVETFEFIRIAPRAVDDDVRDPTSVSDMNRQTANPHNRLFVVYLDVYHTKMFDGAAVRQPLLDFLDDSLGPTDLFAMMTPELPISALTFARRLDTLRAELMKYGDWGIQDDSREEAPRTPFEERLYQCAGSALLNAHRQDSFYSSLEALVVHLGGLREERKNILMITGAWAVPRHAPGSIAVGGRRPPDLPTVGVGRGGTMRIGGTQQRNGYADVSLCEAESLRLGSIDFEQRFRDLLVLAQRSNVSFYPVDTGGLRVGSFSTVDTLLTLAENTGGRAVVNSNDIAGGMRRVTEELSAFYLLGYYSANQAADGRYRRIEVKVKQPGVQVSARHGYLGWTAAMRKAEADAASRPATAPSPVDLELARLSRARVETRANVYAIASDRRIDVVAEIAGREIEMGQWKKGAAVSVTLAGPDGEPTKATGQIDPGARSVLIRVPMSSPPAGAWRAAVTLKGEEARVEEDVAVSAGASALAGEPLVFRGTPSPRAPLHPVADFHFRRVERLHIEWETRAAIDERSARLLNRRGEPMELPVTVTEREVDGRKMLVADLLLSPLPEGDFVVELSLRGGAASGRHLLAFRVIR
jgi:VWFA-related protein